MNTASVSSDILLLLVAQTWQVALLAIVVLGLVRIFAKQKPHLAHVLWALVLIKCLTPPVFGSPVGVFSFLSASDRPTVASTLRTEPRSQKDNTDWPTVISPSDVNNETSGSFDEITVYAHPIRKATGSELPAGKTPFDFFARFQKNKLSEQPAAVAASKQRFGNWPEVIVGLWLIGAAISLLIVCARLALFNRWLNRSSSISDAAAQAALDQLRVRLKVKRRVALKLVDSPVGPAVYGLFRPTILLPYSLVKGKQANELEPLLAHELIHIRRGDLWWATLQTFAACLFWFHPLVRMAALMVTRESERSCDEETVASLGCRATDYAMQLIEVLEHKQQLRVAPALPGVRPVDITSARLERVMKFGNGIHRHTPFWVWLVLAVGCMISLPGAALVYAQQESSQEETKGQADLKSQPLKAPSVEAQPLPAHYFSPQETPESTPRHDLGNWSVSKHDISKILPLFKATQSENPNDLLTRLGCRFPVEGASTTPEKFEATSKTSTGTVRLGNQNPTMHLDGTTLHVLGTQRTHALVSNSLQQFEKFGFAMIAVETHILTMPVDELNKLDIEWSMAPTNADGITAQQIGDSQNLVAAPQATSAPIASTDGEPLSTGKIAAVNYVEQNSPAFHGTLRADKMSKVLEACKNNGLVSITQSPIVVMNNGQHANVYSGSERPFVVGFKELRAKDKKSSALQPIVQLFHEGTNIRFDATITHETVEVGIPVVDQVPYVNRLFKNVGISKKVNLSCRIKTSQVLSVDTVAVPLKSKGKDLPKIQMPKIASMQIQSKLPVDIGDTLCVSGIRQTKDGKQQAVVALLTCRILESLPKSESSETKEEPKPNSNHDQSAIPQATKVYPVVAQKMVDGQLTEVTFMATEQNYPIQGGEVLGVIMKDLVAPTTKSTAPTSSQPASIVQPELGHTVPVNPDGIISLPLLNPFSVKGMTVGEIKTKIRRLYAEAEVNPNAQVTVRIRSFSSETESTPQPMPITIKSGLTALPNSKSKDYQPLLDALKANNLGAKIEGAIDFEIDDDSHVTVQGSALSIDCGDFRVSGDHGKFQVIENDSFIVTFKGNVKLDDKEMMMEADELKFGEYGPDAELQIDLQGNARLAVVASPKSSEKWEMQADHIYFDQKTKRIVMIGKGHFTRHTEGKRDTFKGERIELDTNSEEVKVIEFSQSAK